MADATITQYEVTFILGEDTTPEQAQAVLKDLTTFLEKQGGKVTKHEAWGKRELAYVIKGNRAGFYLTFWADLPVDQIAALEKELRFNEQVIRSLVTKAYTTAQPGSLYPVAEEDEKPNKTKRTADKEESATAEAELRMTSKTASKPAKPKKAEVAAEAPEAETEVSEEERMQKLDEALGDILKDEE